MTIMEQYEFAKKVKGFLTRWGLKQKFVAETCNIPETVFSGFLNGKQALSTNQLARVTGYINEYVRRNS